jgi:hypothetical protein
MNDQFKHCIVGFNSSIGSAQCAGTFHSPDYIIKRAQEEIVKAEAEKAKQAADAALADRFAHDAGLAHATSELLAAGRGLLLGNIRVAATLSIIAKYRKELAPLAASYGLKIVLVGDKSTATVVQA